MVWPSLFAASHANLRNRAGPHDTRVYCHIIKKITFLGFVVLVVDLLMIINAILGEGTHLKEYPNLRNLKFRNLKFR